MSDAAQVQIPIYKRTFKIIKVEDAVPESVVLRAETAEYLVYKTCKLNQALFKSTLP